MPHNLKIMGILNVTPDSFSDGGAFNSSENALNQALKMQEEGADIIDIGAESTRPGATPVTKDEEKERLIPIFNTLKDRVTLPFSIDTYKADIADFALQNGASIINDVWGFQRDEKMAHIAAEHNVETIIMHNRFEGTDETIDIWDDIRRWFDTSLKLADQAGMNEKNIILDPGIGFGKTFHQNLVILARLDELKKLYGFRILMGLSRKRFIGALLNAETDERLFGTLSANLYAIMEGADIVRVHDIKPHRDALTLWEAIDAEKTSVS